MCCIAPPLSFRSLCVQAAPSAWHRARTARSCTASSTPTGARRRRASSCATTRAAARAPRPAATGPACTVSRTCACTECSPTRSTSASSPHAPRWAPLPCLLPSLPWLLPAGCSPWAADRSPLAAGCSALPALGAPVAAGCSPLAAGLLRPVLGRLPCWRCCSTCGEQPHCMRRSSLRGPPSIW